MEGSIDRFQNENLAEGTTGLTGTGGGGGGLMLANIAKIVK
jgi:hypothetical protein